VRIFRVDGIEDARLDALVGAGQAERLAVLIVAAGEDFDAFDASEGGSGDEEKRNERRETGH